MPGNQGGSTIVKESGGEYIGQVIRKGVQLLDNQEGEYICQVIRRGRTFNDERAGIIERVNITMSGMYRYVLNIYKKRIKINAHNAYKLHDGVVHYLMFHDC